jgi:hypothetical protein
MKSRWCMVVVVLWIMTIAVLGWFFIKGLTAKGSDGRTEILLAAAERDHILAEMRHLLKAVDGVVRELGEPKPDLKQMDALADAIVQNETPQQILRRLSSMTARCTACHDMYRFKASE